MNIVKRYHLFLLLIGILFLLAFIIMYFTLNQSNLALDSSDEEHYQEQRIIRFTYEISNQTQFAIPDGEISTYLPVAQLSNQRAKSFKASRDYSEESDRFGNRVGQFDLGLVPPFGKKQLSLTAVVETTAEPNKVKLVDKGQYLQAEPFIEIDHPQIVLLAKEMQSDNEQQSLKNVYDWVSKNIQYIGYVSQDKGALYALEKRQGDCTEYAYLVVALSRALGIPARAVGGYVYEGNAMVSASDYHNWAEVYLDGRWQIVDAQNKAFMDKSQNYISMRILSDSNVSLLGNSHRFLVAQEGLTVKLL